MQDTTQENITAFFHGTSSQMASSSRESVPKKKAKKPRLEADGSAKEQRAKADGSAKKPRAKADGSAKKQPATKQRTKEQKAPRGRPPSGPKKPPKVLQQGRALSNLQQEAQDQNEKKGEHAQLSSSAAHARSQWEAKASKRKLTQTPSACLQEIQASTMPPELQHDNSHPRAAQNIGEIFETLNVNAEFLKAAYPKMGERVAHNVANLNFYTDFTGPDMASLGHMGPNKLHKVMQGLVLV